MGKLVKLIAPAGTDEACHGGTRYRVWNDGSVWVDQQAVAPLLEKGGFALADQSAPEIPAGSIQVAKADDPNGSLSFEGETYTAEGGSLRIPLRALPQARAHGFVAVSSLRSTRARD